MLTIPKPKVTKEQLDKFLKDPEVLTLEVLFILLTLSNIFIIYFMLSHIIPYPVTVTWIQILFGFIFSVVLGECGQEFPKIGLFPRFSVTTEKAAELFFPTLAYLGMISLANVLLAITPSVATFPVLLSLGVFLHHVARFLGCGQIYMPIRWLAITIMLAGFIIAIADPKTMGPKVLPVALLYALCSAMFRAWCLEKAMHVVEGKGNTLHNHQVVIGLVLLPVLIVICGEASFFTHMPYDFTILYTWQTWGVLVTVGTLPFLKNIVANRLIRRTGQAPWRALELLSVVVVFLLGLIIWNKVSIVGWLATILVLGGRTLGMLDVLSKEPEPIPPAPKKSRTEPRHQASQPAPSDSFDSQEGDAAQDEAVEDEAAAEELDSPARQEQEQSPQPELEVAEEPVHEATAPFLGKWFNRGKPMRHASRKTGKSEVELCDPIDY